MEPKFFETAEDLRSWLAANHLQETELVVGIYKKSSGKAGINWAALVDEVLCYGWIDGKARRIDDDHYCIRITPRKRGSIWSKRNIERVAVLTEEGRMQPAGFGAFNARSEARSGIYAFEQDESPAFSEEFEALLHADSAAREFFEAQAPWYQRSATHWVMSAKREETRERRMNKLIEDSAAGMRLRQFSR